MSTVIKLRRGTEAEWSANSSTILASGEPGFELDTGRFKIGDGVSAWSGLYYASIIPTGLSASSGISINLGTNGSFATIGVSGLNSSYISDFNEAVDDRIGSGLFVAGTGINLNYNDIANTFTVSVTGVSFSGHTHVSSDITDFSSSVSGLIPVKDIFAGSGIGISTSSGNYTISVTGVTGGATIANYGDNRLLTSDGTSTGINGESNLTFDGTTLLVNGTGVSVSGHTHTSSSITDFNSSVSGLLPVKNILAGTGISIASVTGVYTITSTGSGINADSATQSASVVTTVFNATASTIPKMSAVYINGGQGDQPTIQLAIATGDATSAGTYGLTFEPISSMGTGKVIVFGALTGVNTDQFNPTAPAGNVNGTVLYLSPSTSGTLTTTKPSAPNHIVALGTIVRTHQNAGVIEVRVQNGFELDELHNVAISGTTNGQFLQYNSGTQLWVPSSSGNFSTLQLNGTTVSVVGHTHTASQITDFNEAVDDRIGSGLFVAGTGVNLNYNDGSNSFTVSVTGLINNPTNNRILTSRDNTTTGIDAESNLTFDGTNLLISSGDCSVGVLKAYKWDGNAWGYDRIIFRSDVNNKITSDSSGNYNWLVAGRNWTLSDVGNVGIKTASPTYNLHVVGSGFYNGYLDVDNLRLDANTISSTNSNGNIVLAPNGTGDVQVDADTLRVGDSNAAATITTNGTGNLVLNTNAGTNSGNITITQGSNGNIGITPNGNGEVDISKVDIDGGSIDNTIIGATSAASGKFTQLYPTVVSNGTVSGSVSTNVANGQIFDMTVSGATTLSNPTNSVDGVTVRWRITQDGTGGHSVSLDTKFQIPSSASSPLPWSTAANATDILAATYHAGRDKWDVVAFVPGY